MSSLLPYILNYILFFLILKFGNNCMLLEEHFGFNTFNSQVQENNSVWVGGRNTKPSWEIILKVIMSLGKILQETG